MINLGRCLVVEYLDTFDCVVEPALIQDELMKRWNEDDILSYIDWELEKARKLMAWEKLFK